MASDPTPTPLAAAVAQYAVAVTWLTRIANGDSVGRPHAQAILDALASRAPAVPPSAAPCAGCATLRPEVRAFAQAMERELRANDHKGGWKYCKPSWLLRRLRAETNELERAKAKKAPAAELLSEAADVANFALMVADVCDALAAPPAVPGPETAREDGRKAGLTEAGKVIRDRIASMERMHNPNPRPHEMKVTVKPGVLEALRESLELVEGRREVTEAEAARFGISVAMDAGPAGGA